MNDIILDELKLNFKDVEREVFAIVCEAGLSVIRSMFEKIDDFLFENRDKKQYRYKHKTEKTIQTIIGDLTFSRRYYIDRHTRQGVFLLDRALDLNLIGRTSQNLKAGQRKAAAIILSELCIFQDMQMEIALTI